jgi:hypothetical protein
VLSHYFIGTERSVFLPTKEAPFGTDPVIFFAEYSPAGDCLWAEAVDSPYTSDLAYAVTTDTTGNAYISGGYNNVIVYGDPSGTEGVDKFTLSLLYYTAAHFGKFRPLPGSQISGRVTESGTGIGGALISVSGGYSAITSADGTYVVSGLPDGDYIVTPGLTDFTFAPPSQNVIISGLDVAGVDFVGTPTGDISPPTVVISGAVLSGTVSDAVFCPETVNVAGTPITVTAAGNSGTWASAEVPVAAPITITSQDLNGNVATVVVTVSQ